MKWLIRIFWAWCVAVLSLVMLAFLLVQFQQNLLRWRAEQLMADMHHIWLYHSNWDDARRLMGRWGAWGHYDGTCTAKDCRYAIRLTDESWRTYQSVKPETYEWLMRLKAYSVYRWLGGRYSTV